MRFSCESAIDKSAHDGTVFACRARRARIDSAQRAWPTGRLLLVTRIRGRLALTAPACLHPVAADDRHREDDNPNKHFQPPEGTRDTVEQGWGRTALAARIALTN